MFRDKVHKFIMTDESDGHEQRFHWILNFNNPEASWKPEEEAYDKKMANVRWTVTPL
jgi:hypothetical protein